jgi:hypothetical protein
MRASLRSLFVLASVLGIRGPGAALSQAPPEACSAVIYSQPEAGVRRYVLDRVEGQAVFASAVKDKDQQNAEDACIALFEEKDRRRIATATVDGRGLFALTGVAPGRYTLVAAMAGERGLAVPIELAKGSGGPRLLLRLHDAGDPEKSLAALVTDPGLRRELLRMAEQDQAVREEMTRSGWDHPDPGIAARMAAVDAQNTARVREIFKQHGWPDPGLVGVDGAEATFLLVQHAEPSFQKEMLPLVEKAFRAGGLRGQSYALLKDRVLVAEGKPQIYGTQTKLKGKDFIPAPIADEANLDKRRAEVGLQPFAEYLKLLKEVYFPAEKDKL